MHIQKRQQQHKTRNIMEFMGKIKLKVCQQTQATTPSRPLLAEVLTCLHYSLDAVVLMMRRPLEALGFSSHTTTLEMAQNTNKNLVPNFYNSFLVYFLHSKSIYSNQKEFIKLFQWCLKPFVFLLVITTNRIEQQTTNPEVFVVVVFWVVIAVCLTVLLPYWIVEMLNFEERQKQHSYQHFGCCAPILISQNYRTVLTSANPHIQILLHT
jgi:hypothetical protein